MLMTFLTVLAYVGAVLGGALFALRVYTAITYTELQRFLDNYRGQHATFPIAVPGLIFVVSMAFLVSKWTS